MKYKIMGNMLWFMSSAEPPRQVTSVERELLGELSLVRGLLQRQWVSVEERLPEQVGNYLAASTMFRGETVGKDVAELSWDGAEWRRLRDLLPISTFGSIVTHWRELPEPPSGAESADIGKPSTFAQWYPEAMKMVERYAPGELGLGNALAELLTRVANGELVSSGAESGVEMGKVNRVETVGCICRWVDGCPIHGEPDVVGALAKLKDAMVGGAETGGEKA